MIRGAVMDGVWLGGAAAAGGLWFSHRYGWWRRAVPFDRPRVLMYHMVSEPRRGARFNKLRVRPAAFEAQLRWLRDRGWTFAPLSALLEGDPVVGKTVVLTFDDGFEDNYTTAFPLMQRYGACGTLFLVADREGQEWSSRKKRHHQGGELAAEPKLCDGQVREMVASGVFELGGHTVTHANLPTLGLAERRREIAGCKAALEGRFDVPVRSFAYPFGLFETEDVDLVREAGYAGAVTTATGIERWPPADPFRLPRVKVSGKDGLFAFGLRMRTGWRGWRR